MTSVEVTLTGACNLVTNTLHSVLSSACFSSTSKRDVISFISNRLRSLRASFNFRTTTFKERAVQPPTPTSDEFSSGKKPVSYLQFVLISRCFCCVLAEPRRQFRLKSLVPIASRSSDSSLTGSNVTLRRFRVPKGVRRLNPARTIDPTSKTGSQLN